MWKRVLHYFMASKLPRDPVLFVLGATGTGKSRLAVDLAKRFNGEIINSDAMQMYAGYPIITNKVTNEEQKGIPHHLLGNIRLDEEAWRVGVFRRQALNIIRQIQARGRIPIVVGGTHYYIQSLLFADSIIGEEKEEEEEEEERRGGETTSAIQGPASGKFSILNGPPETILEKLREVDPIMADRWHPNDTRKIYRSLQIFLQTGEKASEIYARQQKSKSIEGENFSDLRTLSNILSPESTILFWIHAESEMLKSRLDARVLKMVESGLLDEVKSMDEYLQNRKIAGIDIDKTRGIWASIGLKEFEPFLNAFKTKTNLDESLNLSIQQMQAATRRYAKRQLRWIRLKLRPALVQSCSWREKLYLLDGSNISCFHENVTDPAFRVTAEFLQGKKLSLPQELSSTAKSILMYEEKQQNVWFRKSCDTCLVTSRSETEWQAHLKSRKHRGLVKKKLKHLEKQNLKM